MRATLGAAAVEVLTRIDDKRSVTGGGPVAYRYIYVYIICVCVRVFVLLYYVHEYIRIYGTVLERSIYRTLDASARAINYITWVLLVRDGFIDHLAAAAM